MTLSLVDPDPMWDPDAQTDTVDAFEVLSADESVTVSVWCRDDCPDCRRELPGFAAAVEAAGFPDDRLRLFAVDGDNDGELTEEYGVEYIPTIVVERAGEELVRFVEEEPLPAAQYLAAELEGEDVTAE